MALLGTISSANIASPTITGNLNIGSGSLSYNTFLSQTLVDGKVVGQGGSIWGYSSGESSLSNSASGWKNLKSFSFSGGSNPNRKIISVGFSGYIQSGPYYWTWRLYNAREGAALPLLTDFGNNYSNSSLAFETDNVAAGGGIPYQGGVHNYSAQSFRSFDCRNCNDGDTIYLQLCGHSSGDGSVGGLSNGSQILYVKQMLIFHGIVTGIPPGSANYYM